MSQLNDNTNLTVFNFKDQLVRVVMINDAPYWVLVDVCKVLEIEQPIRVAERLKQDGVSKTHVIDSMGREQETICINEPNLYRTIFRSNKPEAEAFQDWVFEEVLPSIRKTGSYSVLSIQLGTMQKVEKIFKLLLEAISTKEILENKQLAPSGLFMLRKMRLMFYRAVRDYEGAIKIYHSKKYKPGFKSSAEPLAIIAQNGDLVVKLQFPFIEE